MKKKLNKSGEDREPTLDELFSVSTGGGSDSKSQKIINKGKNKNKVIAAVASVGVLAIVGGAVAFGVLSNQEDPNAGKKKDSTYSVDENANVEENVDPNSPKPWDKKGKEIPVVVPAWAQLPQVAGDFDKNRGAMTASFDGSDLFSSAGILPSESAGYTSNDDLENLPDGTPNPTYSYWTKEVFVSQAGSIIERFLNPVYGKWVQYQSPSGKANENFPVDQFSDVVTTSWLDSTKGKKPSEYMPVYADWKGNNYGMSLRDGPRWFGTIQSSTTEFKFDEETSQYTVNFVADVKYTSYTKGGETVNQTGTLTLEFVSNANGAGPGGKVLVNKANLTIGG